MKQNPALGPKLIDFSLGFRVPVRLGHIGVNQSTLVVAIGLLLIDFLRIPLHFLIIIINGSLAVFTSGILFITSD